MGVQVIVVVTLAVTLAASSAAGHHCIHDEAAFQAESARVMASNAHAVTTDRNFREQAVGPMRFYIVDDNLNDTSKYCSAVGQVRPSFVGTTMNTCTADDVFTSAHRSVLMDDVIPRAIGTLSSVISVPRVSSLKFTGSCNSEVLKPNDVANPGKEADFILFITAGATGGSVIAWARACAKNSDGRPVVGLANFGPKYLVWDLNDRRSRHEVVATAVHEILHSLGFSKSFFHSGMKDSVTMRGKTVNRITSPTLVSEVRSFYVCPTAGGLELEDEGGSGTVGSHWDRRIAPYEMMAPAGGETLSSFTLAVLKDLDVGYTVKLSAADPLYFGKSAGCGFFTDNCATTSGGLGRWFCDSSSSTECNHDATKSAYCTGKLYEDDLPSQFQHFSNPKFGGMRFFDYCPVVQGYSNGACETGSYSTNEQDSRGTYYGKTAKCFIGTNAISTRYSSSTTKTAKCYETRCSSSTVLDVRIGFGSWKTCDSAGKTIHLGSTWSYGTLTCPDPAIVCDPKLWTNGNGLGLLDTVAVSDNSHNSATGGGGGGGGSSNTSSDSGSGGGGGGGSSKTGSGGGGSGGSTKTGSGSGGSNGEGGGASPGVGSSSGVAGTAAVYLGALTAVALLAAVAL